MFSSIMLLNAGQEDKTVEYEGETTITHFNMKEEMEEGHFDGDGFYHFKKDLDQVKDAWLDDVDWIKVKPGRCVGVVLLVMILGKTWN